MKRERWCEKRNVKEKQVNISSICIWIALCQFADNYKQHKPHELLWVWQNDSKQHKIKKEEEEIDVNVSNCLLLSNFTAKRNRKKKTRSFKMGCELGKLASSTKSDGVNSISPSEPPPPSAPDPRLPLTARQKYTMMASWKGISRAMQPTGINMFIK